MAATAETTERPAGRPRLAGEIGRNGRAGLWLWVVAPAAGGRRRMRGCRFGPLLRPADAAHPAPANCDRGERLGTARPRAR